MTTEEKAMEIAAAVVTDWLKKRPNPAQANLGAVEELSTACALLTSANKAEREQGKQMVRRWKNGLSF